MVQCRMLEAIHNLMKFNLACGSCDYIFSFVLFQPTGHYNVRLSVIAASVGLSTCIYHHCKYVERKRERKWETLRG